MKKSKRIVGATTAVAMLATGLTAMAAGRNAEHKNTENVTPKTTRAVTTTASRKAGNSSNWLFPYSNTPPLTKQKVTLTMFVPANPNIPDYNKLEIFQKLEQRTNVHIKWVNGDPHLLLASGNLPAAFVNPGFSPQELAQYGEDGAFLSWNKYLKYMPNLQRIFKEYPSLKTVCTAPNGQIYSLPGGEGFGEGRTSIFADHHFLFINKKYLAAIHKPVPKTLQELHDDLVLFKTKLGVKYPMAFHEQAWAGDIGQLFGGFGLPDNNEHIVVRNGKVIYTAVQPQYKQAIKYFHSWVAEGLIDPESLTESGDQYAAKEASGKLGAFIDWDETPADKYQNDYVLVGPLSGPTGKKDVSFDNFYWAGPGAFVMTKADPNPVLTAKWIDLVYAPYQASQMHWGPAGHGKADIFKLNKHGELVFTPFYYSLSNYGAYRGKISIWMGVILPDWIGKYVSAEPRAVLRLKRIKDLFDPYMEKEHYPFGAVYFTPQENSELSTLQTNIANYVNQERATWLLKGGVDQQWNSYLATLTKMGLNRYLNILQTALDRYVKADGSLTD